MSPLAVGPFLALVGIVAAFFVLRGKAKTRKSMYRTLRERREVDLRKARERATAAKGAAERTAIEREAAAAAAAASPVGPASAATIRTPAEDAAPAFTPQEPTYAPPAPAPPEPPPAEPAPPAPAFTPQAPTYEPPPPPPPFEQAPAEVLPEPPPTAGDLTKPAWEIVQPEKQEAEDVHAEAAAASSKASWELDPREQQRVDAAYKGRGRHADDEEEDDSGEETIGQVLLSYAGLVLALAVILLGILFMIGGKATH
jgi:hypothetical protein